MTLEHGRMVAGHWLDVLSLSSCMEEGTDRRGYGRDMKFRGEEWQGKKA